MSLGVARAPNLFFFGGRFLNPPSFPPGSGSICQRQANKVLSIKCNTPEFLGRVRDTIHTPSTRRQILWTVKKCNQLPLFALPCAQGVIETSVPCFIGLRQTDTDKTQTAC